VWSFGSRITYAGCKEEFKMRTVLLFLAALTVASGATFNVRDYGAAGDGVRKDTAAIMRAIDACAKAGGGTVLFSAGKYLTGGIQLKSNITLEIDAGATILGSTDASDYVLEDSPFKAHYDPARREYISGNSAISGLIWGEGLVNITIKGRGVLDGQGQAWWNRQWASFGRRA
jgi:polygalacturonase